jgi:uncharacterized surface protein with fasciclin (FAS1) repeats
VINGSKIDKITENFGECREFIWLLELAGFYESLRGEENFTIFAPLDGAFRQLPDRVTARLLELENITALRSLLALHLIRGKFTWRELVRKSWASNLVGTDLRFQQFDNGFYVNDVQIIAADKTAGNGVVHIIDRILLPFQRKE